MCVCGAGGGGVEVCVGEMGRLTCRQLTMSLSREARVGRVVILSRAASRRALSRPDWSTSRKRSTSLGVGSMGTHNVASSTRDAIL